MTAPTWAVEYHVASLPCAHGASTGSDSNSGLSRAAAFATVQKCLDTLRGGDTCTLHSGTYIGDFNCCGNGDSTIENTVGTALTPTRILGAASDAVTLAGDTAQTPVSSAVYYQSNLATLTIRATSGGAAASRFFEVGNLTLNPGNSAALATTRAQSFYVHDIKVTDVSLHALGNPEDKGLFWSYAPQKFLFENITISNNGALKAFNAFNLGSDAHEGTIRMVTISDMDGSADPSHFSNTNVTYEFFKLRNWHAWVGDDGALKDMYNSTYNTLRYWSVVKAPGGGTPIWGWFNSRRTDASTFVAVRSSFLASNLYLQDVSGGSGYGAWTHHRTRDADGGVHIPDWRVFNSVAENFPTAIYLAADQSAAGDDCLMHEVDYNATVNVVLPIDKTRTSVACQPSWTLGTHSFATTNPDTISHVPNSTSPLKDTGDDQKYGGTSLFPPPEGGGARIDIGGYEAGAGPWPYEFQIIATVNKLAPRICWDTAATGCDVTLPLWDPWAHVASSRVSTPDFFWVELDPWNAFSSGNATVARGFGPFHQSGPVASAARFYDVPAGVLVEGEKYYARVRVGEQATQTVEGEGPGTWSLGFYRFLVSTGDSGTSTLDAGGPDAGATDAGGNDAGGPDAGATDAGGNDGGATDAGAGDGGRADGGNADGGAPDGGTGVINSPSCGCGASAGGAASTWLVLIVALRSLARGGSPRHRRAR